MKSKEKYYKMHFKQHQKYLEDTEEYIDIEELIS